MEIIMNINLPTTNWESLKKRKPCIYVNTKCAEIGTCKQNQAFLHSLNAFNREIWTTVNE